MKKTCYLCMMSEFKDGIPKFKGFVTFTTHPQKLSANGFIYSIVYEVQGDTLESARENLLKNVKHIADITKSEYWDLIWKWIDPSYEAHQARYDLIQALL